MDGKPGTGAAGLPRGDRLLLAFAVALGVAMPIVSAIAYPTYFVMMASQGVESTRLIEAPFLIFEFAVILWAGRRGFDVSKAVASLPRDIKIAGAILALAAFAGALLISKDTTYSLTHTLMWVIHAIFALALLHVFSARALSAGDSFLHWHVIGLVLLAVYTAWWFASVPPVEELPFNRVRLRGAVPGWIDVRHFGSWSGAITAAFAVRILYGAKGRDLTIALLCYFIAAGVTVWTGTRAAILTIMVVTFAFVLINRRLPDLPRIAWAVILTALACLAAYLLLPDDKVFWMFTPEEVGSAGEMTKTRRVMWTRTVELWLQSPILGLGTGAIFWEYSETFTPTQPHNVVLQFLVSWGIVGAAGGLWILGRAFAPVIGAGAKMPLLHPMLAMVLAFLFQSMLEGMLHYPRFIISIIVMSIIIFVASRQAEASKAG
ncbi:O-antigen ligase family protein [Qipengyuania sphaerica]|uniref:O-antigen ligase family protein n=1 Tax=Qipengyuania sphaerica TaxID=2867243 RepID=UPI001C874AEA|nr:O-antigen ligase family protein [Qipengyuania sphaerica]MBX7541055.1 O-antigen ligase family protein [Qipengyuania sphaerica]